MLVTEEEAKKKYCPNIPETAETAYCYVSGCMAWRWGENSKISKEPSGYTANVNIPLYDKLPQSEWKGYCGLAGKPEGG